MRILVHMKNNFMKCGIYGWCMELLWTGFLAFRFLTGSFLKKRGICPWNYSGCRFNYKGVIRLDYYPLWFLAGLFFEKTTAK